MQSFLKKCGAQFAVVFCSATLVEHPTALAEGDKALRLEVQVAALPTNLDGLVTENFEQWTVVYNLADRLVEYGGKNELRTNLAKSYRVSADGREYVFELEPNRFFHNGDPVTVEDVIYSLDLSLRNEHSYSNLKDQIACVPGSREDGCGGVIPISANEFKVKLKESTLTFLDKLNMNENAIRSKKADKSGLIVYSGSYKVVEIGPDRIELEINSRHPNVTPNAFKSVVVTKLPLDPVHVQARLVEVGHPVMMINKGFPTTLSKTSDVLPSSVYQYASGNSYLLSLRSDLPQVDLYKDRIQQAILAPGSLAAFPYLKPLSAIYPAGYALASGILPHRKRGVLRSAKTLRIKYPSTSLSSELVSHLTKIFESADVKVKFLAVDSATYKAQVVGSSYDGMIAFPFIDIQDEVRVARGYFSGYWNYFPEPRPDLLKILAQADKISGPDQRTAKMRQFYQKMMVEYPIVPLFFTPNMILMSADLDRRQLEYFGNTMKFDLFSLRKAK